MQQQNPIKSQLKSKKPVSVVVVLGSMGLLLFFCFIARALIESNLPLAPTPTLPPAAPPLYDIMDAVLGGTEVQRDDYLSKQEGKSVSNWSGKVTEVEEYGGDYRITLDVTKDRLTAHLYLDGLTKEDVIDINKKAVIKFSGIIDRAEYHVGLFSSGLDIFLRDIELIMPTLAPTQTPRPSSMPPRTNIVTITSTNAPTKTPTITRTVKYTPIPIRTSTPEPSYIPLAGHINKNVKVYYGLLKSYAFTIIGADSDCSIAPSGKGVLVEYPDGTIEWKDRDALLEPYVFVRDDDPYIWEWQMDYYNCP